MNQMVGDDALDERVDEGDTSFVEHFDIRVGEVRIKDEQSGDREWLWKAEIVDDGSSTSRQSSTQTDDTDNGASYVSGTITDAVMGCIERETDGVI